MPLWETDERRPIAKKIANGVMAVVTFFVLGYSPMATIKDIRLSMLAIVAGAIFVGAKSPTPISGLVRGLLLGAVGGLAMSSAMMQAFNTPLKPAGFLFYSLVPAVMSGGAGFLMALLGRRRRRAIERQWKDSQ